MKAADRAFESTSVVLSNGSLQPRPAKNSRPQEGQDRPGGGKVETNEMQVMVSRDTILRLICNLKDY